jgi:membrane-anchored protein YejM (alkaline phosphatase superfamily)
MTDTTPLKSETRRARLRWVGWFAFGQTFLFLAAGWRYWEIAGWPELVPARLFLVLAFVGHFLTVSFACVLPALLAAALGSNRRLTTGLAVALGTVAVAVIIVDSIVFSLYRFHLNGMVWSLIRNGHLGEILPLSSRTWAIGGILGVLALGAECGLAWGTSRWLAAPARRGIWVAAAAIVVIAAGHVVHIWADAVQYTAITKVPRILPGYSPLTAKRFLRRLGWFNVDVAPRIRFDTGRSNLRYPLEPLHCLTPTNALNVVVVVIDAWRFDMLSEAVTPNIWRFGTNSLRFADHSAVANSTRFGIFAMFYGLCGTYWHAMLEETRGPVLVSELRRAGYQFGAWGAAPLTSPEFDRTVFSEVRDQITPEVDGKTTPDRDQEITRRFLGFLDRREAQRPFFAFVFYDSTHAYDYPADAPAPFQPAVDHVEHLKLDNHYDPLPVKNRFLNAAHYVDTRVAQVLERLKNEGLLERTVVLITGDHGQEFNETGQNYWGHNSAFNRFQTAVPLVLHWPGKEPAVLTHRTSHLDIAPTLLMGLLGCDTPPARYSHGRSLFDPTPRNPLIAANWDHFAVFTPGRIDVIYNRGRVDCYDEGYHEIATPPPAAALEGAMEALSRFSAR